MFQQVFLIQFLFQNYIGQVTTTDNIDFKIENTTMKITPGPATPVRFFVQYSSLDSAPRLKQIRLNGREICNANTPQPAVERPEIQNRPNNNRRPDTSSSRPSSRPGVRDEDRPQSRPNQGVRDEDRPQTRPGQGIREQDRPQTRPVGRPTESDISGPVYVRPNLNQPIPSNM